MVPSLRKVACSDKEYWFRGKIHRIDTLFDRFREDGYTFKPYAIGRLSDPALKGAFKEINRSLEIHDAWGNVYA